MINERHDCEWTANKKWKAKIALFKQKSNNESLRHSFMRQPNIFSMIRCLQARARLIFTTMENYNSFESSVMV